KCPRRVAPPVSGKAEPVSGNRSTPSAAAKLPHMTTLGKKSTAEEALSGQRLEGKTAIVTGATSGIGVETARVLAKAGARVTLAVRRVDAGEKLKATFGGAVQVSMLDLAALDSVRAFARAWGDRPLDLLINNAGIMGAGRVETTVDGFE